MLSVYVKFGIEVQQINAESIFLLMYNRFKL